MRKNDWIGLAASLAVHALLLVGLSLITMAASDPIPLGFIEVEFGPFAQGRPASRSPVRRPDQALREAREAAPEESAPPPVPDEATPVRLPEQQTVATERIAQVEAETIAPESRPATRSDEDVQRPEETRPVRPLGTGDPQGEEATQAGDDGVGSEETRSAPYQIEGLDRIPTQTIMPLYTEQVNADIGVRITVDPSGRIVGRLPLRKGDPRLEEAVMRALAQWRFNRLPAGVPQTNQTGVVTFRFRLR